MSGQAIKTRERVNAEEIQVYMRIYERNDNDEWTAEKDMQSLRSSLH